MVKYLTPGENSAPGSRINTTNFPGLHRDYDEIEARLSVAIADANSSVGGGSGITPAQVQSAVEAALSNKALTDFEDKLLEDSTGAVFISRRAVNENTGATTFTTTDLSNSPYTPVGAVSYPTSRVFAINTKNYEATTSGAGFNLGDAIELVEVINTKTASVTTSYWRNLRTGAIVAGNLLAPQQVQAVVDNSNDLLDAINSNTSTLISVVSATNNVYPGDNQIGGQAFNNGEVYLTVDRSSYPAHTWFAVEEDQGQDIVIEESFDGGTWVNTNLPIYDQIGNLASNGQFTSSGLGIFYYFAPKARFFRFLAQGSSFPPATLNCYTADEQENVKLIQQQTLVNSLASVQSVSSYQPGQRKLARAIANSAGIVIGDLLEFNETVFYTIPGSPQFTGWRNLTQKTNNISAPATTAFVWLDALENLQPILRLVNNNVAANQVGAGATNRIITSIFVENLSATPLFLQIFQNLLAAPVSGATVPTESYRLAANGAISPNFGKGRVYLGQLWVGISTTNGVYTASTALKNLTIEGV